MIDIGAVITQSVTIAGRTVDIRRLDRIHPEVNGNKWYKLKYNLESAVSKGHHTVLTFGGPWSNHIHAAASACKLAGLRSIGIIRGEEPVKESTTIAFARACGMKMAFISREMYDLRDGDDFKGWLVEQFGEFYSIPEGGANFLGINGCMEILNDRDADRYDLVCCACGTGATLAGILLGSKGRVSVMGFSALRGGSFLQQAVLGHVRTVVSDERAAAEIGERLRIETRFHFGGYGKWSAELESFILRMEKEIGIPFDQVYTGKMMYGIEKMLMNGELTDFPRILIIHSGGLQGRASMQLTASNP
jgi:1-aminocyclopropane-1-carboxylate deaminase